MHLTSRHLTKTSALAAVGAGALFIAVQIGHPAGDAFTVETDQWVVRSAVKAGMAALALAGLAGLYLRQHRQAGVLGLAGYVVFSIGYLAMFSVEVIAFTVLPQLVDTHPGFVNDVVAAATGGTPDGDIGALQTLFTVAGVGYMLGGLLFGIALFRARVMPRWAAALLSVSTVATAALAVLPESFSRPMAVPEAVALIALGVALWRNPVDTDDAPDTIDPAAARRAVTATR
jgi:hypothetical protein